MLFRSTRTVSGAEPSSYQLPVSGSAKMVPFSSPFVPSFIILFHPFAYSWIQRPWTPFLDAAEFAVNPILFAMSGTHKLVEGRGVIHWHALLIARPCDILVSIVRRLNAMGGGSTSSQVIDEGQMRTSTFYALVNPEPRYVMLPVSAIAMAFGVIHCAGWSLAFPSSIEALTWRISSIAISVAPLLWFLVVFFCLLAEGVPDGSLTAKFLKGLSRLFYHFSLVMLPIYVLARILLLFQSFIGLRALNPGALTVVKWTGLLPHI